MSPSEDQIVHVSDTALMVAACRAIETERPNGLIRDPFAQRLAGARGMAIARALPGVEVLCMGVGIRSCFLDELVTHAVTTYPVETVLSAGCGLDTRPWRLDLPPKLRWVEVDFAAMLDYKGAAMQSEAPKCGLERVAADLNDPAQRQVVFSASGNAPALMITEGLLTYLPAESVEAIATESVALSGIRYWLMDLSSRELHRRMEQDSVSHGDTATLKDTMKAINKVRSTNAMDGNQILDLLGRVGWIPVQHRSYTKDSVGIEAVRTRAAAARQRAGMDSMPPPPADDPSGVYLFEHGSQ